MADGSGSFNFPLPQRSMLRPGEIVVDLFAGGGGASEALKQALGADPALAYNHDELAIGMHAANHQLTSHHREDIWHADPRRDVAGRPIGWFHASPDCTHFSQAKGGQPRSRKTRALTWVVIKWLGQLRRADVLNGTNTAPRCGSLENVWQILTWGPLIAKRDKATGRVLKMDGTVADKGERVPVENQQLVPDKRHAGRTWRQFVAALRALGYAVEWRKLTASDYGAGTSRTRLFAVYRRDGVPIRWPAPTHGKANGLLPLVTAADCIDWSIPCPSIFSRKKPLADATHRRIAKGIQRYVLGSAEPFIVGNNIKSERGSTEDAKVQRSSGDRSKALRDCRHSGAGTAAGQHRQGRGYELVSHHGRWGEEACAAAGSLLCGRGRPGVPHRHLEPLEAIGPASPLLVQCANSSANGVANADAPLATITAWPKGGSTAVVAPMLVQAGHGEGSGATRRRSHGINDITGPLGTVVASGGGHSLAAAHLVKFRGDSTGSAADEPMPTITSGAGAARPAGAAHAMGVMTAFLEQANGGYYDGAGNDMRNPAPTICGTGSQQRLVTGALAELAPEHEAGALRVAAFLMRYYGTGGQHGQLDNPLATVTTKDRLALVTVTIKGTPYVIVDIGLRMLKPHELYRAQGFPADYIIDRTADGRRLTTSAAVRMVGNSVSPPPLRAIAEANLDAVPAPMAVAA